MRGYGDQWYLSLRVSVRPIKEKRLKLSTPSHDDSLWDWNRRSGRPRQTWLRAVESDVAPLHIGLATAYHPAQNRQARRSLVETATSTGQATSLWPR